MTERDQPFLQGLVRLAAAPLGIRPANDSKGCGGVMRVAPLGLVPDFEAEAAFDLAAHAAAITHAHPSGYLSAGALAAIVRLLLDGADLGEAARAVRAMVASRPGGEETARAIDAALDAAGRATEAPHAMSPASTPVGAEHAVVVERLGQGWVGEEALAVGLYAALVARSFEETVRIAANHDGDSDSTASIAGQLHGVWKGVGAVPHRWARHIDVLVPLLRLTRDLLARHHAGAWRPGDRR